MKSTRYNEDFTLAREAINYARERITASATDPHLSRNESEELDDRVDDMRYRFFSTQESLIDLFLIPNNRAVRLIKRDVRSIKEFHIGNCHEYANLVMNYLRKKNITEAETVHIEDGDHVFVVINRNQTSDMNDPCSWGEKAFIIDAWSNDCYFASEIYNKLHCYREGIPPEKPNILFPFTRHNHLKSKYAIHNGNDDEYKMSLINEMHDKLEIIKSTLSQHNQNEILKNKINALYRNAYDICVNDSTNFDVERKCNKIIRHSLKLIDLLPSNRRYAARSALIKSVILYVKETGNSKNSKEFFNEINMNHQNDVISAAKFILNNKK